MSSFNEVNYSLRPSKSIQRNIVFEGIRKLQRSLNIEPMAYIGLGSIWFTDYILAQKFLNINAMVSFEDNEIGYARACFNKPFSHVTVRHGTTNDELYDVFQSESVSNQPALVWLDYDSIFNETMKDDIQVVLEEAKEKSILIITFNANERRYGAPVDLVDELKALFGDLVPDSLSEDEIEGIGFQFLISDYVKEYMLHLMAESGRIDEFLPSFRIVYRDSTPMVTVGGVILSEKNVVKTSDIVNSTVWRCMPKRELCAPNLTIHETIVLRSRFPSEVTLTRKDVQSMGFDLKEDQIIAFGDYYREFPVFAEINS